MRTALLHAAPGRPRKPLAATRSASHQKAQRAPMLLRRAAPSNETSKTSPTAPPASAASAAAVVGQILPFRAAPAARRVSAPPNAPTIVILPGFGNAAEDYCYFPPSSEAKEAKKKDDKEGPSPLSSLFSSLFASSEESTSSEDSEGDESGNDNGALAAATPPPPPPPPPPATLASALEARGFPVAVVAVKRSDWLRVAWCAVDPAYWRGEAEPETAYGWYLDLAERAVEEAALANPSNSGVVLLAHSAGGWLARALVGRETEKSSKTSLRRRVRAICTLGTPHAHNEARCVTGGALASVNARWPGAYFSTDGDDGGSEESGGEESDSNVKIRYVAVAGRAVVGDAFAPRGTAARAAAAAYSQVAGGDGHGVAGDGVVPLSAATLPGADNVVLDGVFHAPRRMSSSGSGSSSSSSGQGDAPSEGAAATTETVVARWFGEEAVVDSWLPALVKALED